MAAAVAAIAAVMIDGGAPDTARRAGLEVYGDSAYGTGAARAAYQRGGHDTVIKPKPLLPAVAGGFTLDDFTIDEAAATVTCPGGHTRTMTAKRTVTSAVRPDCPLRARCTTATGGRSMSIHPYEQLLRAARAQARTPEFQQAYPTRSMVERIVAWTATDPWTADETTLPRRRQEPRLAANPLCGNQFPHTHQRRPEPAGRDLGTDLTTTHTPHPATPEGCRPHPTPTGETTTLPPKSRPTPQPRPSRRYNAPLPTLVQSLPSRQPGRGRLSRVTHC